LGKKQGEKNFSAIAITSEQQKSEKGRPDREERKGPSKIQVEKGP